MELITRLEKFGVSKREAEVYIALLQKKEFTAPELTKITTTTRTKIYEHLQNLIQKGLCNESLKNGQKIYRAVKPRVVLRAIIAKGEKEIEQRKVEAASLEQELEKIYSMNMHKEDNLDYVEIIQDRNEIRSKFTYLQENAKKEILVFNKPPYSITPEDNMSDEAEIICKGIKYRTIYEYSNITHEETADFMNLLSTYSSVGETVRVIEKLPIKLAIIDEEITMLALIDPISLKPSITTMVVHHSGFALTQKEVFEAYWNKAITPEKFQKRIKI